jgi:hypothetical protein
MRSILALQDAEPYDFKSFQIPSYDSALPWQFCTSIIFPSRRGFYSCRQSIPVVLLLLVVLLPFVVFLLPVVLLLLVDGARQYLQVKMEAIRRRAAEC